jgi:predicted alpha/beta hydrolase family esterase
MKTAVLLHGTDGSSQSNWLPWLEEQLTARGYTVWTPDLPDSHHPETTRYNEFILAHRPWKFDESTLIVGHSSGAVAIPNLLTALPPKESIGHAVLVSSFTQALAEEPEWRQLQGLFSTPFRYKDITSRARKFTFVHAANDPYCPVEQPIELATDLEGTLILFPTGGHFSAASDPTWHKFPQLIDILESNI